MSNYVVVIELRSQGWQVLSFWVAFDFGNARISINYRYVIYVIDLQHSKNTQCTQYSQHLSSAIV
jgi:hypothetical protein